MWQWRQRIMTLAATVLMLLLCMCAPTSADTEPGRPPTPPSAQTDSPDTRAGKISALTDSSSSSTSRPELQAKIAALLPTLPQLDPQQSLDSLASDIAIARAIDDLSPEVRRDALRRALQEFVASTFVAADNGRYAEREGARLPFSPTSVSNESLKALREQSEALRQALADGPLERRLRELLGRPGAVEALLALGEVLSSPSSDSGGSSAAAAAEPAMPADIAPLFRRDANGNYHIIESQREAAKRHLEQLRPIVEAGNKSARRLAAMAPRVQADTATARRYQAALRDPVLATAATLKIVQAGAAPEDVPRAVEQEALKPLREAADGRLRLSDPNSPQLAQALKTLDELRSRAAQHKSALASLVERIGGGDDGDDDALHAAYRQLLSSDVAALAAAVRSIEGAGAAGGGGANEAARALALTPLADVLIQRSSRLAVTRWRRGITSTILDQLEAILRDGELIGAEVDELVSKIDPPVGRWQLITAVSRMADARADLRLDAWAATNGRSADELRRIVERATAIDRQLANEERPMVVDLQPEKFSTDRLGLLRSSVFYNPRTPVSRQIYAGEFPRHEAARLWGPFEWDVHTSSDFDSYLRNLHARRDEIVQLARTHEKLMVILSFTPPWLSRSDDSRSVEGHWQYRNAVRPKDWATWERMVTEAVKFFAQFEGVQWYFEVWNEPDLPYWQEGTIEYLELYAHTARAVKRAAPQAKVGGSAVNHWQGKPRASRSREPLNVDLIRYAAKHGLPLDFVSWHVFNSDEREVDQAVQRYREVFRESGFDRDEPELIVTEWNIGIAKGTERAAGAFAERMLTLYRNPIGEEFFSAWEEFNPAAPADDNVGPWGMITQRGRQKAEFHVLRLFDELARHSGGVAVFSSSDDTLRALVSRRGGETSDMYDILVWETGFPPGVMEALDALKTQGFDLRAIESYQTVSTLEEAIRTARPLDLAHRRAFEHAKQAYERAARRNLIHLSFEGAGAGGVEVLEAKRVALTAPERFDAVFTRGSALVAELPRMNVLWLTIRTGR